MISVATGRFIWRVGDLVVEGLSQLMMAWITSSPWHWGETFCPWKWKLSQLIVIVESLHWFAGVDTMLVGEPEGGAGI